MQDSSASSQSKKASVTVQEVPSSAEYDQPRDSLAVTSWIRRCTTHVRGWTLSFLPCIGQLPVEQRDKLQKLKSIPWFGFACLLFSLSTVIYTFIIFFKINGHIEFLEKYVRPASWLSAIVSANSIALHVALHEGASNAWWYQASRSDVTMQKLHETYVMGTGTIAVLRAWKRFNYVAMATIFVATIPLNGFLLQNAINMVPGFEVNGTHLYVPVTTQLPLGFSANLIDGTVSESETSDLLYTATSSFDSMNGLPAGISYDLLSSYSLMGCVSKDQAAVCKGNVTIAGFTINCSASTFEAYDLQPSSNPNGIKATVFSQNVTWDPQQPDVIGLDLLYKPNQTCSGFYVRRSCQFPAAMMNMTVQINSDRGLKVGFFYDDNDGEKLSYPAISLDAMAADRHAFNRTGELAAYPGEGQHNSTYGGIAQWLGQKYNASIDWKYSNGTWQAQTSGVVARSYSFLPYLYQQNQSSLLPTKNGTQQFNPTADNASYWCRNVYRGLDWVTESGSTYYGGRGTFPEDGIFVTLNKLMLSASIAEFNSELSSNQTLWDAYYNASANLTSAEGDALATQWFRKYYKPIPDAKQFTDVGRYEIRWGYYGGSVVATASIIIMILPLFYGFWSLERRQTLSPIEIAVAFDAPGFEGIDRKVGVDQALKELGRRPVHMHAGGSDTSLSPVQHPNRSMSRPALR